MRKGGGGKCLSITKEIQVNQTKLNYKKKTKDHKVNANTRIHIKEKYQKTIKREGGKFFQKKLFFFKSTTLLTMNNIHQVKDTLNMFHIFGIIEWFLRKENKLHARRQLSDKQDV